MRNEKEKKNFTNIQGKVNSPFYQEYQCGVDVSTQLEQTRLVGHQSTR